MFYLPKKSINAWALLLAVAGLLLLIVGVFARSRHVVGAGEWALEIERARVELLPEATSKHAVSVLELARANKNVDIRPETNDLQNIELLTTTDLAQGNRVFLFLRSDCPCSLEFAGHFSLAQQCAGNKANFIGVFEQQATTKSLGAFRNITNASFPFVVDQAGTLAKSLGVTKAGAFALVRPNGSLDGLWNGCSGPGLQDLLGRVGLTFDNKKAPSGWDSIPGTAVAGCPLISY